MIGVRHYFHSRNYIINGANMRETANLGRLLEKSGDDGVIDQDALGVVQIYVQAKTYVEGNSVGCN